MSSPGLEGHVLGECLPCSGASVEEGEAGETCPFHTLFSVSSSWVSPPLLGALPGLTHKLSCPLCAFAVHP